MPPVIAVEKRLESESGHALEIMGHVRDWLDGLGVTDTKAALIDPILSALSWELRDPFSVSKQYRHKPQDNPVEYALFILRAPVIFVEAKALNRDLSDYKWISQTIAYANAAGVEWCVLTNGDEYGQRFTATIESDGLIRFDGQTYSSPSHAGGMVRNKVNGPPPNGRPYASTTRWTFWHYKEPVTGHPQPISKWLEGR